MIIDVSLEAFGDRGQVGFAGDVASLETSHLKITDANSRENPQDCHHDEQFD